MTIRKSSLMGLALAVAVSLSVVVATTSATAQDKTRDRTQERDRVQEQIYGSQLMTWRERRDYRAKMRTLKTEQEREAYRLEHHQQMQERARAKGVTLPDRPPAQRGGPGAGAGSGAGPGGGMGGGGGAGGNK